MADQASKGVAAKHIAAHANSVFLHDFVLKRVVDAWEVCSADNSSTSCMHDLQPAGAIAYHHDKPVGTADHLTSCVG